MKPIQHWGSTDHLKKPRQTHSDSPIKTHRIAAGLTQAQLAEALDVSVSTVRCWEQGVMLPSAARLIKLKTILGVSIDDLIG